MEKVHHGSCYEFIAAIEISSSPEEFDGNLFLFVTHLIDWMSQSIATQLTIAIIKTAYTVISIANLKFK